MNTSFELPLNAVFIKQGRAITTSIVLTEIFEKEHRDVLYTIRRISLGHEFGKRNFTLATYVDGMNRKKPMYEITMNGFMLLAASLKGDNLITRKIFCIERFDTLEEQLLANRTYAPSQLTPEEFERLLATPVVLTGAEFIALKKGIT